MILSSIHIRYTHPKLQSVIEYYRTNVMKNVDSYIRFITNSKDEKLKLLNVKLTNYYHSL